MVDHLHLDDQADRHASAAMAWRGQMRDRSDASSPHLADSAAWHRRPRRPLGQVTVANDRADT